MLSYYQQTLSQAMPRRASVSDGLHSAHVGYDEHQRWRLCCTIRGDSNVKPRCVRIPKNASDLCR